MQLTVTDKKKQWIYLGIIVASLAGMGWMWFGSGSAPTVDTGSVGDVLGGNPTAAPVSSTLPYGPKFDVTVMKSKRYQALVLNPKIEITAEELGRVNPFLQPGTDVPPEEKK